MRKMNRTSDMKHQPVKTNFTPLLALGCLLSLLASMSALHAAPAPAEVASLRCEYLVNPLGVDVPKPRLSWKFTSDRRGDVQTAYQILVASTPELLAKDQGDLWDSGKVESDQSILVKYAGNPLKSRQACFWKVKTWTLASGLPAPTASSWSAPASFEMGLLEPADWTAKWITTEDLTSKKLSHPWLRRTFELTSIPKRAVIHMDTPSYYELYINGQKATPYVLTPGMSQNYKRFLVNSWDVTSFLKTGTNCIALWMGPGWYQPKRANPYNAPILRAQLNMDLPDGQQVIGTGSSWRIKESCISQIGSWSYANFGGERFDAREDVSGWEQVEFNDAQWANAREIPAPKVVHSWQGCESARLSAPMKASKIYQLKNGKWVIDFGRPLTGWMKLRMRGLSPGGEVSIVYADVSNKGIDGFQSHNQKDSYIGAGKKEESFCSRFNYHSFRYAVISGLASPPEQGDAEAMMIEPELDSAGEFSCSNDLFNQIHEITRYTFRTQNPTLALGAGEAREKSGYGDGGAHLSGYLYNFACAANFRKWLVDWCDTQRKDGWIANTAPAFEGCGGGPAWGGQTSELVRRLLLYYGDRDAVENTYDNLRRYVDFQETKTLDGILRSYTPTNNSQDWMFIGDWARPTQVPKSGFNMDTKPEREFFNSCYLALLWQELQDFAEALGRSDEAKRCSDHLAIIRPLIHKAYFQAEKGEYIFTNQSALAMALYAGIPPKELRPKMLARLEQEIVVNHQGHLDTGLLGTFLMLDLLIKENRNDLIALIMAQTTYPSWGYFIKELGLNIWPETWSGWGSQVILVTATPGSWFFEGLGGISPDPAHPGFKHFTLRPAIVKSVDWVKCSYESPYGKIASNWKRTGDQLTLELTIPVNTTARVSIPTKDMGSITESGKPAAKSAAVKFLRMEDKTAVYEIGSGHYEFKTTNPS